MNQVVMCGRMTKDPEVRYSAGAEPIAVVSFTLAVDRGKKKNGESAGADYVPCKVFGKSGENLARFSAKGTAIYAMGHMHSDSYENKEGKRVYTFDFYIDRWEFPLTNSRKDEASISAEKQERADLADVNAAIAQEYEVPEGFSKIDDDMIPF